MFESVPVNNSPETPDNSDNPTAEVRIESIGDLTTTDGGIKTISPEN
jgi:hypothetical protein